MAPASIARGMSRRSSAISSGPKTQPVSRSTPKAPALTTATAWSSALTGLGATIAAGSQAWSGRTAALTPTPTRKMANRSRSAPSPAVPARNPPGLNPTPGASQAAQTTAANSNWPANRV